MLKLVALVDVDLMDEVDVLALAVVAGGGGGVVFLALGVDENDDDNGLGGELIDVALPLTRLNKNLAASAMMQIFILNLSKMSILFVCS